MKQILIWKFEACIPSNNSLFDECLCIIQCTLVRNCGFDATTYSYFFSFVFTV
jgi:hypothetical protein